MDALVRDLAQMRIERTEAWARAQAAQAAVNASSLGKELADARDWLSELDVEVEAAEQSVREVALACYASDGDTKPHPAVTIKLYTVLEYDDGAALSYARDHLPQALKLDKATFEKAAKALELDFVSAGKEPRATIAKDLAQYLTTTEDD